MIVTPKEPFVALSTRTAAWLEANANMGALRVRARGVQPEVAQELMDLREAARMFEAALLPQAEVAQPEVGRDLNQWLSTVQVADREGISDSAVRLACREGRIEAGLVAGRWQITEDAYQDYRAARSRERSRR